jgi:Ca2+-binding EF-hand superfamily protein
MNGNAMVTREEIMQLLDSNHCYANDLDITMLMTRLDKDRDGKISFSEFAEFVRPTL